MSNSNDVLKCLAAVVAMAIAVALTGCMSPQHQRYASHLTHAVEEGDLAESAEIAFGRPGADAASAVVAVDPTRD